MASQVAIRKQIGFANDRLYAAIVRVEEATGVEREVTPITKDPLIREWQEREMLAGWLEALATTLSVDYQSKLGDGDGDEDDTLLTLLSDCLQVNTLPRDLKARIREFLGQEEE